MPRKKKVPEPEEVEFEEEEYVSKKAKIEVDSNLLIAVLDVMKFYQDPSGNKSHFSRFITYRLYLWNNRKTFDISSASDLVTKTNYKGITAESSGIRAALKSAVHSGQLMQVITLPIIRLQ